MPFISVKMLGRESTTPEQKEQIIAGITQVMVEVMHKKPESTTVVIEEISLQNWGVGGQSIAQRDAKQAANKPK